MPLLTTDIDPLRAPSAPGVNVTPTAQLLPALTVVQELLATVNSLGLLLDTLDTFTALPPMLEIVTLLGALVVPTAWLRNSSLRVSTAGRAWRPRCRYR